MLKALKLTQKGLLESSIDLFTVRYSLTSRAQYFDRSSIGIFQTELDIHGV